ncbi:MAG: DinB family protein [bacterium]|nr:DinB family protein [bacterium]
MTKRELKYPSGYDAKSQSTISLFAAQLDDQLLLLKESVAKLTVPQLEWQPQRGMNTIGMLLAHLAVVEVFWINVASKEIPSEPDGDEIELKIIGIRMDDDGLPIPPDGLHPATLSGKSVEEYFTMLDKARAAIHEEMQTWRDSELEGTFTRKRGDKEIQITRSWTLYHLVEHFAGHFGQILLLKHMMRSAGVLETQAKD